MPKTAKPRKHGSRWQINWTDGSGKRRYRTYGTHKEAQAALRVQQADADAARAGAVPAAPIDRSFDELAALWTEAKHAKRSLSDDQSRIRIHLRPAFGHRTLREITPARITRFQRDLSKRLSVQTVAHVLGLLRAMLRLAEEHRWLAHAPKIRVPRVPERDYQWLRTEDEMASLLHAARQARCHGAMQLYATALYTGMRSGELCGLRWQDVDVRSRLLTVQRSHHQPTKTAAIRRVPIFDPLLPVLSAWRDQCGSDELVFPNIRGNMHVKGARITTKTYQRCLEDAGLGRIRFHDLRHTFASHYMLKGGDLFRLQKILGHKSIKMTQRYAHLSPDAFRQDWTRFGDFVPGGASEP